MGKLVILIPARNECETIGNILSAVPKSVCGHLTTIVVSDDRSTDGTAGIAKRYTDFVLESDVHEGVGAATRTGLAFIAAKLKGVMWVVKLDGDGQHDLELLPSVVSNLKDGSDLVICSRFHPFSKQTHTPTDRILLNMMFTKMVRTITSWNLTDVRSGYVGFPGRYAHLLGSNLITAGYGVPMEIVLRIWDAKPEARVTEIPHPALYGPHISEKINTKYSSETVSSQAKRLFVGYQTLLTVIKDLGIPRDLILKMNGFCK